MKEEMRSGEELLKEEMLAKMETNQERMDVKIDFNQEKMEAMIDANNGKFEVLQGTLISRVDIYQVRTMSSQEKMKAKMDIHQEKMEATSHSIRPELEETIRDRVEDVLLCVNRKTQSLQKELTEKIDETQMDLQAVKASPSMCGLGASRAI
jgi:hypothetical protein